MSWSRSWRRCELDALLLLPQAGGASAPPLPRLALLLEQLDVESLPHAAMEGAPARHCASAAHRDEALRWQRRAAAARRTTPAMYRAVPTTRLVLRLPVPADVRRNFA